MYELKHKLQGIFFTIPCSFDIFMDFSENGMITVPGTIFFCKQVELGNLVSINTKSTTIGESPAVSAVDYGGNASDKNIPQYLAESKGQLSERDIDQRVAEGKSIPPEAEVQFSTRYDTEYMNKAIEYNDKEHHVTLDQLKDAARVRNIG